MLEDYLNSFPGHLVRWVLDEMRKFDHAATAWENLDDEQKDEKLDRMRVQAEVFAQTMVDAITKGGSQTVKGTIESVTFKQGVKVVVNCSKSDEYVGNLAMQSGGAVHLLLPQLALDLEVTQPEQQDMLSAIPGWQPSDDEPECICPVDEQGELIRTVDDCPVHGPAGDDGEPDPPDDLPGTDQPSGPDSDLDIKPENPADEDDPESENVG